MMENEISYTFKVTLNLGPEYEHAMLVGIPHALTFEGANAAMVAAALLPGIKGDEEVVCSTED
jgi:hypothetical protein